MTEATVKVGDGDLRGREMLTLKGKRYFGFQGIPYAKPPLGNLRFKAPEPPEPWFGMRDATVEGNISLQVDCITQKILGDEDCLYINVYTPTLPREGSKPLPVMVHTHGGGFYSLSGNTDISGPDFLIDEDVVVVTFNYRLGILGFLPFDLPEAPGNVGLKDQVMALRWVQRNIQYFNGEPSNVTIFGISAGAASVGYHMISPMSKGLFHKAIGQSGTPLNPWARATNAEETAAKLAKSFGKRFDNLSEAYNFLRELSGRELVKAGYDILDPMNLELFFVPTVEKKIAGVEHFLTEIPLEAIRSGRINSVPLLSGFCNYEAYLIAAIKPNLFEAWITSNSIKTSYIPSNSCLTHLDKRDERLNEAYRSTIDFGSDVYFIGDLYMAVRLLSKFVKPIYFYEFAYDGGLNLWKQLYNIKRPGASHADDWGHIFRTFRTPDVCSEIDGLVRKRLTSMWTNFAKHGNPTPALSEVLPTKWEPVTQDSFNYLRIDESLTMKSDLLPKRMQLFEDAYQKML